MASTTLFAPQVRSVQPAFIYEGEEGTVKIYFNLSSYNVPNDIRYILYSIIDPNQASSWGSNLMFVQSASITATELLRSISFDKNNKTNNGEYYIEVQLDDAFKTFTTNQFYQVQLYFSQADLPDNLIINSSYLSDNKDNISEPSQVTLIRPIAQPNVTIDGNDSNTYDFSKLTGSIADNIETFDSYYCVINDHKFGPVQGNGKYFSIPIDNSVIKEGSSYSGTFYYTTIHGYSSPSGQNFTITYNTPQTQERGPELNTVSMSNNGYIKLICDSSNFLKVQRESENISGYWETVDDFIPTEWKDYTIESNTNYKYRLVTSDMSECTKVTADAQVAFDDIFLSDEEGMLAVRFNPNISGFKWATQESITNTLGGRYPIVRKNGDTKYRQFNLSGTIDCEYYTEEFSIEDSQGTIPNIWYCDSNTGSLYLKNIDRLKRGSNLGSNLIDETTRNIIERDIRHLSMDLLTNGKPKLFRSFEEGNMIVYLSNISFTPNKTLGRHIYDFSATVTEICDYTAENLKKYRLNLGGYEKVVHKISQEEGGS